MITAILLASGFSRRMDTDKLLLDFHGIPVIEHTMQAISLCSFDEKLLVQREDAYTEIALRYDFRSLKNPLASQGQSRSVQVGIHNSHRQSSFMFFTGDQPCLTAEIICRLFQVHREFPEDIIVPAVNGNYKNPVIFPSAFRTQLLSIEGDQGGRSIMKQYPDRVRQAVFEDALAFHDIDTRRDYEFLLEESRYR